MAKKILVVDDELDVLQVTAFRLKKSGYDVITAVDGQQALDLMEKDTPDLLLLDLRLPIVNGTEVCKKVKRDEKLKNVPVILFTASAMRIKDIARELGADDYILKPFDTDDLLKKIKKFIG